jgi:hypothetical protein
VPKDVRALIRELSAANPLWGALRIHGELQTATTLAGIRHPDRPHGAALARQNAYIERVIGSIRRECLDHVIVANETGLRRVLEVYVLYYMHSRTHLTLAKDSPVSRPVQSPSSGRIAATPEVGRLHHRYERVAA